MKFTSNVWSLILRGYFSRLKILTSLVMSLKVNLIDPFLQLMFAFAVARNEYPKIMGVWEVGVDTGLISRTIKSTG